MRSRARARNIAIAVMLTCAGIGAWLMFKPDEGVTPLHAELGIDGIKDRKAFVNREGTPSDQAPAADQAVRAATQLVAEVNTMMRGKKGGEVRAARDEAYRKLATFLEGPLPLDARRIALVRFNELASEIFFSSERNDLNIIHNVAPGESVARIADKYGVTEGLICLWNNIDPAKKHLIRAGASFKIVEGKPRVVVRKSEFCLSYYFGDKLAQQFIVAHGIGNKTPEGVASVISKVLNPDQQPGAGENQLEMAERWIGLSAIQGETGIGIHGTKYEESIPGETSKGCIRMRNAEVVRLYEWLPRAASVEIRA